MSSICPHRRAPEVLDRIGALNAGLSVLCDELGATFINNDPSFHLQDGSVNDGYLLPDGVHLTKPATNKLVTNFEIATKTWRAKRPCRSSEARPPCSVRRLPWAQCRNYCRSKFAVNPTPSTGPGLPAVLTRPSRAAGTPVTATACSPQRAGQAWMPWCH